MEKSVGRSKFPQSVTKTLKPDCKKELDSGIVDRESWWFMTLTFLFFIL
jgi:hypothetical protein